MIAKKNEKKNIITLIKLYGQFYIFSFSPPSILPIPKCVATTKGRFQQHRNQRHKWLLRRIVISSTISPIHIHSYIPIHTYVYRVRGYVYNPIDVIHLMPIIVIFF